MGDKVLVVKAVFLPLLGALAMGSIARKLGKKVLGLLLVQQQVQQLKRLLKEQHRQ